MVLDAHEAAELERLTAKAAEPAADEDPAAVAGEVAAEVGAATADAVGDTAEAVADAVADAVAEADPPPVVIEEPSTAEVVAVIEAEADAAVAVIEAEADADVERMEAAAELAAAEGQADDDGTGGADVLDELLGPIEEVAQLDEPPAPTHWWFRSMGRRS